MLQANSLNTTQRLLEIQEHSLKPNVTAIPFAPSASEEKKNTTQPPANPAEWAQFYLKENSVENALPIVDGVLKENGDPVAMLYELHNGAPALKISSFHTENAQQTEEVVSLVDEAIEMGRKGNHERLVIDVSGNGGGDPNLSFRLLAKLVERFDSMVLWVFW